MVKLEIEITGGGSACPITNVLQIFVLGLHMDL